MRMCECASIKENNMREYAGSLNFEAKSRVGWLVVRLVYQKGKGMKFYISLLKTWGIWMAFFVNQNLLLETNITDTHTYK